MRLDPNYASYSAMVECATEVAPGVTCAQDPRVSVFLRLCVDLVLPASFDTLEGARSVMLVCKRWYAASRNPRFWFSFCEGASGSHAAEA